MNPCTEYFYLLWSFILHTFTLQAQTFQSQSHSQTLPSARPALILPCDRNAGRLLHFRMLLLFFSCTAPLIHFLSDEILQLLHQHLRFRTSRVTLSDFPKLPEDIHQLFMDIRSVCLCPVLTFLFVLLVGVRGSPGCLIISSPPTASYRYLPEKTCPSHSSVSNSAILNLFVALTAIFPST